MKNQEEEKGKPARKKRRKSRKNFTFEFKLRAVKLFTEEGVPKSIILQESGISSVSLDRWISQYRKQGESGLESHWPMRRGKSLPGAVRERIVALKKENPARGVRFISSVLRRFSFLKASPETVRKTLHQEKLIKPEPKKRPIPHNKKQPRFFERATPNQMWQSDIFTFFLGGSRAYLIGFIDDNSRYIPGLGLYRSQTADNVVETYRKAIGEYGPPKEMLTDNGRQYITWRGTGKFPKELRKNGVHHIRSTPHHPMTLGKIERFWKTIHEDFISRAQFASFDEAQERIRLWIQYYNHQRPHQSLDGLCPADRFFKVAVELRKTIEAGIKGNLLEMALHGKPKEPFYMVGRMGGKSVVMSEEKGTFKVSVENQETAGIKGVEYNLPSQNTIHTTEESDGKGKAGEDGWQAQKTDVPALEPGGEMPCSAGHMDGAPETDGDMPGASGKLGHAESMGEESIGGDDACVGTAHEAGTTGARTGQEAANDVGKEGLAGGNISGGPSGGTPAEITGDTEPKGRENIIERVSHESGNTGESGPETGFSDLPGAERRDNGTGGSPHSGNIADSVLRMGGPGASSHDGCAGKPGNGAASGTEGRGEGILEGKDPGTGAEAVCDGENGAGTGGELRLPAAA